jgi:DNA recombination protein RmuC
MTVPVAVGMILLILLILFVLFRKLSAFTNKESDRESVITGLQVIHKALEQVDRSIRDEVARNRHEHSAQSQALRSEVVTTLTGIGDSVSTKVEGLTRSNDQKLELLRSGMEQRLDSFTAEAARKIDGLTQSVVLSSARLQDEVSAKLAEFRTSLESTVKETHQLQRQQTDTISGTIQALQGSVEDRQLRLQTMVDTKLVTIERETTQKLTEVESALRNQAKQFREEASTTIKTLGDDIHSKLIDISQLQRNESQDLKATVDGRLATIQSGNEKKLEQMRQTVDEKLQGTLEVRLGESFKQVSDRLEQVHRGLGEMQTLAAGVGDLKRSSPM